jgi:hypothetical protein
VIVPTAACVVVWSSRAGYWAVTIPTCPLCGKKHHHGGGTDPQRPVLGHRASHCVDDTATYDLSETPASREARFRRRAKEMAR